MIIIITIMIRMMMTNQSYNKGNTNDDNDHINVDETKKEEAGTEQ